MLDNLRVHLWCNCKKNPLGIDKNAIQLSITTENIKSVKNIFFNIYEEKNCKPKNLIKSIESNEQYTVNFSIPQAICGEQYFWNVSLVSEQGNLVSDYATFEIGLCEKKSDSWIQNKEYDGHVSNFYKVFSVKKEIIKARLYICGLGFYNSYINGQEIGNEYFKPLLTDYDNRNGLNNSCYDEKKFKNSRKSIVYDTYDITDKIIKGENRISVLLGTGWYCNVDKDDIDPSFTYSTPKLFFEIRLFYENNVEIIKSDTQCFVQNTNIKSQLYRGDFIDFTAQESGYISAEFAQKPTGEFITTTAKNDKIYLVKKPVESINIGKRLIYDFGENYSGAVEFIAKGIKGSLLRVRHYETIQDGEPNPDSSLWIGYDKNFNELDRIEQDNFYILSGGIDEIKPYFHWNCFRYVEFECDNYYEITNLKSLFICSDIKVDGKFNCSNNFLNNFYNSYVRTQLSNMHCGVPSDCPHREKLPYTGDGYLSAGSAFYSLDVEGFYRKWLDDIIDSQSANGWIPYTAPYIGGAGGAWWSNALVILPFIIYNFSGDKSIFKKVHCASIKLVNYYDSMHNGDYIIKKSEIKWIIGEWLNPVFTEIDLGFMNTLGFYFAVIKTIEICEFCNEKTDKLLILKEKIKKAILEHFYDETNHEFCNGIQGATVLPIALGVLDNKEENKAWKNVVIHYRKIRSFDTGIVLTPILLEELMKRNQYKLAYKLMTNNGKPSFRYMLKGETTLCEHWNKKWPPYISGDDGKKFDQGGEVSHCHPIFGSVVAWFHKSVAGLDLSKLSERKIIISPKYLKEVKKAEASKLTIYGLAYCKYEMNKILTLHVIIPSNCSGEINLKYNKVCVIKDANGNIKKLCPIKGVIKEELLAGVYEIKEEM